MATFTFGRTVDIHWNGFEVVGPAGTVFSIPDQLYEEFNDDIFPVEPTLTWIDTNEFLTLSNSVSVSQLQGTFPISVTTTTSGKNVSISSSTNPAGYTMVADGTGGVIFQAASTGALTSIVGVSPMSTIISGNTASVIIDQAGITGATAATNAQVVRFLVKNTTGTTIPKGSAVYVSGATGDNALISLASATSDPLSSKTLGLTQQAIDNDAFGYVVEAGYETGIDTSSTTAGASVWLGNVPGSIQFGAPPAEPSHAVYLGVVVRDQQINGSILVKVQNGYEIDELHDVSAASPSDGDILQYKTSSSLWTKASIANAGIASSVHTHDYQPSGSYQTAGTYVNAVVGTSPASVSTTSGTATVSIVASSINSTHLADNAVVAASIAAAAVGTVAINSGSATNSTVLTADGSGGAAFLPVTAGASLLFNQSTWSGILTNTASTIAIGAATATASNTHNGRFTFDETSGWVFQISGRNSIVKSELSSGTVISTTFMTALATNERLTDISVNTGSTRNLCVVSQPLNTTTTPPMKYYVIDPAAMTTKNTGNIAASFGTASVGSYPRVTYDEQLQNFVVRGSVFLGGGTNPKWLGLVRTINPTSYATRVHSFGLGVSGPVPYGDSGGDGFTNLIYVSAYTGWIGGTTINTDNNLTHWIDSGATSQFLTEKSKIAYNAHSTITSFRAFATDPNDTSYVVAASATVVVKFSISSISSGFTTTLPALVDPVSSTNILTGSGGSGDTNLRIVTNNGTTYLGHPNGRIIDTNWYSSTYSSNYWDGPSLVNLGSGIGNLYYLISESNQLKLLISLSPTSTTSSVIKYTIGSHLNIDFVGQSSASNALIGIGAVSQTGTTVAATSGTSVLGTTFDSTGVGTNWATSGSNSIKTLKAGYTFRYRYFPAISTSNTTVSLPDHWILN